MLETASRSARVGWRSSASCAAFAAALQEVDHPEVRELFTELRDEEVEHQEMVLAEMARVGDEPTADPEDYVDPPVAH